MTNTTTCKSDLRFTMSKYEDILHKYDCGIISADEIVSLTGKDDIIDYLGEEDFYVAEILRSDYEFELGILTYNYVGECYCIDWNCSDEYTALNDGDSFEVWHNGLWRLSRILFDEDKELWYLTEADIEPVGFVVRGYYEDNRVK